MPGYLTRRKHTVLVSTAGWVNGHFLKPQPQKSEPARGLNPNPTQE